MKECITALKRHRASGPDDIPPALFKDGGEYLTRCLTELFASIWGEERVPDNWGELLVVPIFEKGTLSEYGNHRGTSLNEAPGIIATSSSHIISRVSNARRASGISTLERVY